MIELCSKKEECCGCGACYNVCPKGAITMEKDYKGFVYPKIDEEKCIKCGLCLKVCDFKNFEKKATDQVKTYAVRHKNIEEVNTSMSGAFFMVLCDYVLSKNGVVFGCAQEDKETIVHKFGKTKKEVNEFKGSKYVQSDLKNTFKECKNLLTQGIYVLFSGTGCQIHGLLSYLKITQTNIENLLTCDIVCHGVPSAKVWGQYIEQYEKNKKIKIDKACFRDKQLKGWHSHFQTFKTEEGNRYIDDSFARVFNENILFRESCYECKYATPFRNCDFTMADYWGVENVTSKFSDNKGVSLVLLHSEKAKKIFQELEDSMILLETRLEDSLQPQLKHPAIRNKNYEKFWSSYRKNNYKAVKKLFFPSIIKRIFSLTE